MDTTPPWIFDAIGYAYHIILPVFVGPRWLFGISEPSTVKLEVDHWSIHKLSVSVRLDGPKNLACCYKPRFMIATVGSYRITKQDQQISLPSKIILIFFGIISQVFYWHSEAPFCAQGV